MPCNVRIVEPIQLKTDIKSVNKLSDVLKQMGIRNIEIGTNVSYYDGNTTKRDAKLVIRAGRYTVAGKQYSISGDVAFVPSKKGQSLSVIYEAGAMPDDLLNIILQAYAKGLVDEQAKQWGGFITSQRTERDGAEVYQIGDQLGKTTTIKVRTDGKVEVVASGGRMDVCSPVASQAKLVLAGIEGHSHGPGGTHVHADGSSH